MRNGLLAIAALSLAACGGPPSEEATAPEPEPVATETSVEVATADTVELSINVSDGFIMAPPGGRNVTMGGMNISVAGGDVRLVGAVLPSAEATELHTMSMEEGVMQMRMVDGFDIADGETFALERGGNHLMLFGVGELTPGESEKIELVFETGEGETQTVDATLSVRALGE